MSRQKEEPVFNRVEELRISRGLTRQQLADRVGVHYQTIGYLERGEYSPSLILALKIARALDAEIPEIFSIKPFKRGGHDMTEQPEKKIYWTEGVTRKEVERALTSTKTSVSLSSSDATSARYGVHDTGFIALVFGVDWHAESLELRCSDIRHPSAHHLSCASLFRTFDRRCAI